MKKIESQKQRIKYTKKLLKNRNNIKKIDKINMNKILTLQWNLMNNLEK